uniref:BTB domain-containing protein n=1 Tax=Panagrolaimus sp. PS1159 TaxID=55785 RepID=A0AC35GMS3_9BILA
MFDYYPIDFELPGYEYLKFKSHIRRIKKGEVILTIENPYDLRLNGKKGNLEYISRDTRDIYKYLTFIFDPRTVNKSAEEHYVIESRPNSVLSFETPKKQKIIDLLNFKYADLIFVSSDNMEISCHKCFMSKHSQWLAKLLETEKNKAKIRFNSKAETLAAALDFYYGEYDFLENKGSLMSDILKFAKTYDFTELKEACCTYFKETVDPKNVCEFIQIAYSHDIEELKEKCKQIMNEKKAEIDQYKLKALPKDILFDLYVSISA